ncbi:hypothetical protein AYI69_g974 [Smittium culicis]|uniref:Uncharacterized protein n=1 Tax=Smittium culicis TaxID=133412 RepID=A0A1R1YRN0_9FUNG|nr:hypothetical protein AYI69_g974 [Smittium culicis]
MKDERPVFSQGVEQSYFNVFSSFEELLGIDTSLILGSTQIPNSKKDISIESEMLNRNMCSAEQSLYKNESVIGNYLNNEYEALRIGRDTLSTEKYLEFGRLHAPELLIPPFDPYSGNIYGDYHNIECTSNKSTNRHHSGNFIPQNQDNVELINHFDPFLNSSLFGSPNFDSEIFQSQNASKSDNLKFSVNSNDLSNNINALNPGLITNFVSDSEKYDFTQFNFGYNLSASGEALEKYVDSSFQNNYDEPMFQNIKDKPPATTQTILKVSTSSIIDSHIDDQTSSIESKTIGTESDLTNLVSTICNQDSDSKKSCKKKLQFVYVQKEAANEAAKYNAEKTMLYVHYNKSEDSNDKKNLKSRITNIPSKMP